jgi:hypothetical protein
LNATRELTDALISGGMHPADAAMLVARAGVEMAAVGPSKATLRTRKWRANKASQTVTGDDSVTVDETVTKRHKPSPNVTSDDASLSLSKTTDQEIKKKRESAKASQLPVDWRPDETAWQAAVALIGQPRCELELTKFRNHAADKGRVSKNWNAAWRNWIDRAIDYGARNVNGTGPIRTNQAAGPAPTRDTAIIAGMGRALERRRAARDPADGGRQEFPERGGAGPAAGDDAEPAPTEGDDEPPRQLAFLPAGYASG